jgi:hypothetical protein
LLEVLKNLWRKFWKKRRITDLLLLVTKKFLSLVILQRGVWECSLSFSMAMGSIKMVTFCKSGNCPSSQSLLAFQNSRISEKKREEIKSHFAACEFCAAEAEFYAHYPQPEENVDQVEIPIPLLDLAKALLNNKHKDFSVLNQLLGETESVKI